MKPACLCVLALCTILGFSTRPLVAAEPSAAAPPVAEKVRQLMQDRSYAEAVVAIDEAAKAKDAPQDYLAYLKGWALYLAKQYDPAVAALEQVEKQFPKSPWVRRARFAKAVALARKGDFRSAELIYRAEAEHLLSADRKQQIADIYLEFADAYFRPPKEEQKPDYPKALEFYKKALEVGPKLQKRIEVELRVAECHQHLKQIAEAANLYAKFSQDHPKSPLDIEARYRLGECRLAEGNRKESRRVWQDLLAAYPDAQSERIAEARFHLSRTWGIPQPDTSEGLSLGAAALEAFIERFPVHKLASQAHLNVAQSYEHRGRYDDAAKSLLRFLKDERHQDRKEIPDARRLLGVSYRAQKKFAEALAAWREYLAKHPTHEAWSAVQQKVVNTEFDMGLERFEAKQYDEAVKLWSEFLAKHPLDSRNPDIFNKIGRASYEQKKYDAAIADWRRLVSKYPRTEEAADGQWMIGVTLEQRLGKLEEALEEYRKVTWGIRQGSALQAIARLTAKSMTIATERPFRSDGTPKLKLTTRNIESVTVRAYKVDLETYFRKMHLAEGVEQLNIALIDPDRTFEFKVPKYAKYQQLESEVEVPLPEGLRCGVMAVTVSSPTLEATAMVLQSDLEIIVKSSRDEAFVLAENMRTGKPWPAVRLLVSDGRQVFAEGVTGGDGVFKASFKELTNARDVRVFAAADGHVASNAIGLDGLKIAQGLADKGYLYTDRPAYRAGQRVHVRGCLRQAAGDLYTVAKDKKYALTILDYRSRQIWKEEVKLGPFGTFHAQFTLPPSSPQGVYRILAKDEDGRSYQGTFRVREYRLEPIRLAIDTPRRVYYRGEEIEGTIRAAYYYGAPLAGREIRYQLAGDRLHTAKTDSKGEVRFKLPTREFSEIQMLALAVTLPEHNVQTMVNFVLAQQGFSIHLSTLRPVFMAGETFELTARVRDAEGKPGSEKLVLKVLEATTVEGKVGERPVEEHPLQTAADGLARQTLKLEKGGRYVLRAEGMDRFKNPVSESLEVRVSDEEDQVRLRILADQHTYKVGDTAKVRVHWREEPALALVTFQGARVLEYQLLDLKRGENLLAIPMTAALAPNFEFSVAVMTDGRARAAREEAKPKADAAAESHKPLRRFHTVSSPFTVERDLKVTISLSRKDAGQGPVRPGDEVAVTIATTDPQGKPIPAELSLAMVKQSLLERFAWPMPSIQEFFYGTRREPAVRTDSSITFACRPRTNPINPRLLAERDRQEIAREEAASRVAATGRTEPAGGEAGGGVSSRARPGRAVSRPSEPPGDDPFGEPAAEKAGQGENPFGVEDAPASPGQQTSERVAKLVRAPKPASRPAGIVGFGAPADPFAPGKEEVGPYVVSLAGASRTEVEGALDAILGTKASARSRAEPPSALSVQETGYWNPVIVTGKDGKATVTFTVPEESTAWTLAARGITAEALAGEGSDVLVVKKDLFGELKLPLAFTDGDEAEIGVTVHNDAIDKGPIVVVLKTSIAGRTVEEKKTIDATAKGIHELAFRTVLRRPETPADEKAGPMPPRVDVAFELLVAGGNRQDVVRRAVPLQPYGMMAFATASGSATSDTTVWVESPKDMPIAAPGLQILVGPTVERSLMDTVLAPAPWCRFETDRIASELETATSDLMASLGLQKLLAGSQVGRVSNSPHGDAGSQVGRVSNSPHGDAVSNSPHGDAGGPDAQALDEKVRSSLGALVSAQNDDGGWSWTGRGGASHRYSTARAVWAMGMARKAGYAVADDPFNKALGYLRNQIAAVDNSDFESKAILLHALSTVGQGEFALANHLYRDRPSLSGAALVHLALAFVEMDRKSTAGEMLDLLAKRNLDDPALRRLAAGGALPWNHAPAEIRGLYALAAQAVAPQSPKAKELVEWLLAQRVGHRWSPDKATGPAALALCTWFAASRFDAERYKLTVFVNDVQAKVLDVDPAAGTQVIDVPQALLKKDKQRVNFQLTGRGRYSFQCILGGFVPADKLKGTTAEWKVERTYEPAPLELDGKEIPRGFGIVEGTHTRFQNPLTQLPVGRRGIVKLSLRRTSTTDRTPQEQLECLVVTEPIPSGTSVIENSVRGGFDHFEVAPGAITFYVGSRLAIEPIHYELYGYLPGAFRAAPTVIRNAYRPEQLAVSTPQALAVLPRGAASSDKYRPTPQELFELGNRLKAKGEKKTAGEHFTELVEKWNLPAAVYRQAIQALLEIHLELGPPGKVVHYFEIVKEKWPEQEIPFDQIVKVGAAYHEMGEYERSYLIFRATVESSFARESGVAGFLDAQGEFLRSVDVMSRLLGEYPPEGYLAAAQFGLSQQVHAKAPQAAADPKLRQAKVNRVDLVHRAWAMLEGLLTEFPEDPAADQAAFSAVNALLELKDYKQAAAACNRYAHRYPKSELLDSFWYVIGYCHYATGQPKEALEMCRKVAEAQPLDPQTGRPTESANKWRAVFILGQVYHSLGQAAEAIREYRRVEDRFTDAKRSIEYFLRKAVELPEVTTVKPGEAVEVDLKFRNLTACDVKVYRIDLMKFSLFERSLGGITRINLAGIRPQHETAVQLGDGKDYRDRTHKLALPLKKEGAYLVVCRGENLHASGLVLITPLAVEVQADLRSRQVRAMVKDAVAGRNLSGVQVKVIGVDNDDFVSGVTDLRGVFVAEGIRGAPTVIVEMAPSRYAFFRGQTAEHPWDAAVVGETEAPHARRPRPLVPDQAGDVKREPESAEAAGPAPDQPKGPPAAVDLFETPEQKRIQEVLKSSTRMEFVETPLTDVIDYLKELHKINIQLDNKSLSDVGVATDTPITRSLKGISLRSALRLMLKELDLTYVIDNDVLLITTPEQADARLPAKVYPVGDLVRYRDTSGQEGADFDSLIDLITSTVRPTTWDAVGGPGSVAPFPNTFTLVVSQTQEVHEEIVSVLEAMRKVKAMTTDGSLPVRERLPDRKKEVQGFGGGFGAGMGGMGGMGATHGTPLPPATTPGGTPEPPTGPGMVPGMMPGAAGPGAAPPHGIRSHRMRPPAGAAAGDIDVPFEQNTFGGNELLQGVQDVNRRYQGKQVDKLKGMQKGGMGGVGAGAAF